MLIHLGSVGQFGNCYLSLFHILANSLEYNYPLRSYSVAQLNNRLNLNFEKLSSQFDISVVADQKCKNYKPYMNKVWGIVFPYDLKFLSLRFFSDSAEVIESKRWDLLAKSKGGLWFYKGWKLRDFHSLRKHRELILGTLEYSPEKLLKRSFGHAGVLKVGVHVRRGDYKNWKNGRYCYSDEVFIRLFREIIDQHKNCHSKINFHLFSNEALSFPLSVAGCPVIYSNSNNMRNDLIGLSYCDLIVGPPSTYSRLASFLGEVPIFTIYHENISYDRKQAITYLDSGCKDEF